MGLNQELVFADLNTAGHYMKKFQRLIGAHLKSGNNFLLIKVGNLRRDWRLIVSAFPHQQALKLAQDNAVNPILVSSVVYSGESLELRGDLLPPTTKVQLNIIDSHHAVVAATELKSERKMSWKIEKLDRNKLYYCRVSVAGQIIEEPFYYGDPEASFLRLSEQTDHYSATDELVAIDLSAQLNRLKHLLLTENRSTEAWDQKVAQCFSELENSLAQLALSSEAFRHAPGTHLRGYRSSVDGQTQNYWIHVPEKTLHANKSIPLVVVLPWTAFQNLPFLESYQMAAFDENERFRLMGDEYGFAVLQVWGRGNNHGGTAIWNADVFEALEAVRRDYPIDMERVYLLGYCEGGRQALILGERYPDRFAAIAVEGPITVIRSRPSFNSLWVQYSSPITQVANLINTPVFINHEENENPPVEDSESFAFRAREAGASVTLVRTHGGQHGFSQNPMAVRRSLFEFFRGKQRNSSPRKVQTSGALQKFGVRHGPIEDAFGGPILVVVGTQGSPEQNLVVQNLVAEFKDAWQKTYFVECPSKTDAELSDADIQKYNLIVVGDKDTNSLTKRAADRLPLQATASGISVEGRTYEGPQLGYEFISPNPLNPSKYIVVIGMSKWTAVKEWKLHPSRDGVCDFLSLIYAVQSLFWRMPVISKRSGGKLTKGLWIVYFSNKGKTSM
jgi:dienelactone hydrolase